MLKKIVDSMLAGTFFRKAIKKVIVNPLVAFPKYADFVIGGVARYVAASRYPVKSDRIVFMTYQHQFTDNPKYICERILAEKLPYDLVFIGKKGMDAPEGVRTVSIGSAQAYKEIFSAKIWIDNALNFTWFLLPKKRGQVYINTWHGAMGLKKIDRDSVPSKRWKRAAYRCGKKADYMVSNSLFENEVYRLAYWPKTPVLLYGHPRNDILFETQGMMDALRQKVCAFFGVDEDTRFALYAPTNREYKELPEYFDVDYEAVLRSLNNRFGGKWAIIERKHLKSKKRKALVDGVYNGNGYPDMQELMIVSDVGISDYSSWVCDYVLMSKPVFLFVVDLEKYQTERGFYYPLETTPFILCPNNDELVRGIESFDEDEYARKAKSFLADRGSVEDGHASKRVVSKIKEIISDR